MFSTAPLEFLTLDPPTRTSRILWDGKPCSTSDELLPDDLAWATNGSWHPDHHEFGELFGQATAPALKSEHPLLTVGKVLLASFAVIGIGVIAYKMAQAITDEDFGTAEFPAWFRKELIDEHVARHGWYCTRCDCTVTRGSLTVDHIVALANGGRTSRGNAAVLCLWCNSSKGARNSLLDHVRGRAA